MFGAGTVTPSVGQRENGFVKAGDAAINTCHGTQVLLVLHRGLLKPSMQIQTVLTFKLSTDFISKKTKKKINHSNKLSRDNELIILCGVGCTKLDFFLTTNENKCTHY